MSVRADERSPIRADRRLLSGYDLAPPRQLDNGSWAFEAVASTPGVNPYPDLGIVEYVSEEALSDPDYLAALAGLPVIDDPSLHWPGVTPEQIERARIGTVLSGRWDAEQKANIVSIIVDTPRGIEQVRERRIDGISLHYQPETIPAEKAPTGEPITAIQTKRGKLNHFLLTPTPNDGAARIRADEASMDPEKIAEKIAALEAVVATLVERADMCDKRMDEMKPKADEAPPASEPPAALDARADTAADWRRVVQAAERFGVKIDDGASLTEAMRAIVKARLPNRADSASVDSLAAMLDALCVEAPARPDVWTDLAARGTVRSDAAPSDATSLIR